MTFYRGSRHGVRLSFGGQNSRSAPPCQQQYCGNLKKHTRHITHRRNSLFFCDAQLTISHAPTGNQNFSRLDLTQIQPATHDNLYISTCPVICLQILAAMQAAPKPLSILTTAIPGAQLLSMPRSAAMPPRPVP